jgi:hypothetical protein
MPGILGADFVRWLSLEFASRSSRGVTVREFCSDLVVLTGWLDGREDRKATGLGLIDGLGGSPKSSGSGIDMGEGRGIFWRSDEG